MDRGLLRGVGDAALAAVLTLLAIVEIWLPLSSAQGSGSPGLSTVVAVILCLSLAARRRWPLATALVVTLAWPIVFSIQPILILFWGQLVPIVVATYSVARYGNRAATLVGAGGAVACLLFFDLRVVELQDPGEVAFHWLVVTLAWVIGIVVRNAERRAAESRRLAIEIATEARTRTLAAIADERARIARELHDIVAHAVSVMVVQAGAAEQVIGDDPEYVRGALATIRSTGADALTEMRRVVSMLRESEERDELRPQPGIEGMATLIEEARAGGLDVTFTVEGEPHPLAPGLDLATYRIAQEALTNVRRHALASRAEVTLFFTGSSVQLEVRDDGTGGSAESIVGHGLIGMRERVALYGGNLETVPSDGAGFIVRATLPVTT